MYELLVLFKVELGNKRIGEYGVVYNFTYETKLLLKYTFNLLFLR